MVKQRLTSVYISPRNKTPVEPILNDKNFIETLNWYRQTFDSDREIARKWLIEFSEKEMNSKGIDELNKIDAFSFPYYLAIYARQYVLGNIPAHRNMIVASINAIVFSYRKNKEKLKEQREESNRASPIQKAENNASKFIADIEDIIDSFIKNNYKEIENIDFYVLFQGKELKGIHAKKILDYYTELATELHKALLGKDEQLKEAYQDKIGVAATKRYAAFITKIVVAASNISRSAQASRKPRNSKKVEKNSTYDSVKYLKISTEYQVKSIEPSAIIGSTMFMTFNEVYRTLTVYYAEPNKTLDIKSTSVVNFDSNTSFSIILRKPKEVLPRIFNGGKKYIENTLDTLKVKKQEARSVLNNNTILLRSLKG